MFSSYFLVLKPGDGSWGTWTPYKNCPNGSLASAFRLRIQDYQGNEPLHYSLNSNCCIVYIVEGHLTIIFNYTATLFVKSILGFGIFADDSGLNAIELRCTDEIDENKNT